MCSKHNPTKGMTKEEMLEHWVNESNKKFNNKFNYSAIKEISIKKSPIVVSCPIHGEFNTTFDVHLSSKGGCPKCGDRIGRDSKRFTFDKFLEELDKAQPNRDYKILTRSFPKNSVLKNQDIYVQSEHGLHKIKAYSMIKKDNPVKPFTSNSVNKLQYFINRSRKLHNYKYTYNNFVYYGAKEVSFVTCPKHGDFETYPNNHLNGCGCNECFKEERKYYLRSDNKTFITKAMNRLGTSKDIYDKCEYVHAKSKVLIKCIKHGYYEITPNDHLTGYGCKDCSNELGAWKLSEYINICGDRKPILYKIKMYKENEEFIKIGITVESVKERYNNSRFKKSGYKYEVLKTIQGEAGYIWKLEKRIHSFYRKYKYIPKTHFQGYTECFTP